MGQTPLVGHLNDDEAMEEKLASNNIKCYA
jgi:hypothetical protein